MAIATLSTLRFAKFTKKKRYIKVRVPDDVLETLDTQTDLGRECLQTHILTTMSNAMHGIARHDISDDVERRRIIRQYAPAETVHN